MNVIELVLEEQTIDSWSGPIDLPFTLQGKSRLPNSIRTWPPRFLINGNDILGNSYDFDLQFDGLVLTTTGFQTIFDTRLSCSNWPSDQWKIDPIRNFLRMRGFDPSTLGREITALSPFGCGLNVSEKEWAFNGDCFVGVLTARNLSINMDNIAPSWTHGEAGLSYEIDKPIMAFVEKSVKLEGIYANLDENHIVDFDPWNSYNDLNLARTKIMNFRAECDRYKSKKTMSRVFDVGKTLFAAAGIAAVINFLIDDDK